MRPKSAACLILLSLFAGACVPEGLGLPQSPLLRFFERRSGSIAYLDRQGNVRITDQTGTRNQALTEDAAISPQFRRSYTMPIWGPSRSLAFASEYSDITGTYEASLWVVRSAGSSPESVFLSNQASPVHVSWSPTGDHVGVLSIDNPAGLFELRLISPSSGETPAVHNGRPLFWAWRPDGQRILIHSTGGQRRANARAPTVYESDLDGSITDGEFETVSSQFRTPAYSPSGDRFLFVGLSQDGSPALMLSNSSQTMPRALISVDHLIAFDWAPDEQLIAFISDETEGPYTYGSLQLIDLRGGRSIQTTTIHSGALAFFWSPDGTKLAYVTALILPPEPEEDLVRFSSQEETLSLQLHVYDVNEGSSAPIVRFEPTPEFIELLPLFDQYQRTATIWSPDSTKLVLPAITESGTSSIFVVPSSGEIGPRQIAEGSLAFWSWD